MLSALSSGFGVATRTWGYKKKVFAALEWFSEGPTRELQDRQSTVGRQSTSASQGTRVWNTPNGVVCVRVPKIVNNICEHPRVVVAIRPDRY